MSMIIRIVLIIVLVGLLVWNYRSGLNKQAQETKPVPQGQAAPDVKPAETKNPESKPTESAVPVSDTKAPEGKAGEIAEISVDELSKVLAAKTSATLIDVRETDEYTADHVPGAILYPLSTLNPEEVVKLIKKHDLKEKKFYLICRSGKRSKDAAERFQKAGAANPVNVTGGTNAWIDAGNKTAKGKE